MLAVIIIFYAVDKNICSRYSHLGQLELGQRRSVCFAASTPSRVHSWRTALDGAILDVWLLCLTKCVFWCAALVGALLILRWQWEQRVFFRRASLGGA